MKIFYFTATGNSLHVAKTFGGELYSIPRVLREDKRLFKDDRIGIIFPCYYWGVPASVETFLQNVILDTPYLFMVMTYGNMPGAGLDKGMAIAREHGMNVDYGAKLLMIDNYLPLFEMAEQLAGEGEKRIEENLERLVHDVARGVRKIERGSIVKRVISTFSWGTYKWQVGRADKNYRVTRACTRCGICARVCPRDNIEVLGVPKFRHDCEMCYACLHNCPAGALHVKGEKSAARFRNAGVTVGEIMKANS